MVEVKGGREGEGVGDGRGKGGREGEGVGDGRGRGGGERGKG